MATKKQTRASQRKLADRPPSTAERIAAIQKFRKEGGTHYVIPENRLVDRKSPARTLYNCRYVIASLARGMGHLPGAEIILDSVADALERTEKVVREVGAESDFEREARAA